jgi:F-type H+-transporting ATPase subunit b
MNTYLMLAAASEPAGGGPLEQVKQIARTFGWNPQMFVSQVILFLIVGWLLKKYAYAPVLKVLEERRKRIAEGLENAERIKKELANTQAKTQEIMTQAGAQATKMIEEARAAAARVQEQETQKAIRAAEQIVARAREATEADRARMMTELRREIGQLAVKAAMQVTGRVLTAEDQRRLAEETNRQLAA